MNRKLAAILLVAAFPILSACATTRMSSLDQGLALYRDGRYEAAMLAFDNAVLQAPGSVAAYNNRAGARLRVGHLVSALGDYTKAIELSPGDPELYFNRANAYMALGNYDFAVQDLNRAIELAPHYAKAYFNRGTARLRNGDRPGADADWRYAIAIEPDPWAQAAMVRSAGLGTSVTIRSAVAEIPGTLVATVPATAPSALPAFRDPPAPSAPLDARALALRGVSREIDGDRVGALADLRAAHAQETDPARRAHIANLLRSLESR
ncbi:MAG: tetratricopeptide repeat protein [Candidatus Rokubacteria bacterium]|nr:tetratricopeptide repeat protein [Candidatus Rokubacteria bacterium]